MEFRTGPGRKAPGDEILYARSVSEIEKGPWEIVKMQDLGRMVIFFHDNEERLKQSNEHWYRGGMKIVDYLRDCIKRGQRSADVRHKLAQPSFDWFGDGGKSESDNTEPSGDLPQDKEA